MSGGVSGPARRYAEAAFAVATERRQVDAWRGDLARMAEVLGNEDVSRVLDGPGLDDGRRVALAVSLLGDDFERERLNLLKLVVLRRRAGLMGQIRAAFEQLVDAAAGRAEVEVTTAQEPSQDEVEAIRRLVSDRVGGEASVRMRVDPAIIGGVVIRRGDRVTDGSVRRRLAGLRQGLLQAAN